MVSENEYELTLRHDTKAPRHRLWFYFSARNARPNQKVLLHVVNFSKTKSLYRDGMSPTVRTASCPKWARVHPKNVFYYKREKPEKNAAHAAAHSSADRKPPRVLADGGAGFASEGDENDERAMEGGGGGGAVDPPSSSPGGDGASSNAVRSKNPHVLSFVHCFDRKPETTYFCYSYPFGYSRQQTLLDDLEAENLPFLTRRLLCRSLEGRRCDVLLVDDRSGDEDGANGGALDDVARAFEKSDPPDEASDARELEEKRRGGGTRARREPFSGAPPPSGADKKSAPHSRAPRPVAMLCCRVHPGETPSSHALWGFVSYLCGRSKSAEALRRRCAFAVVPMLNPDGCFRGNYRTDSRGRDLNRHWVAPSPDELPTLHAAKALASRLARDPRFRLDFFVDVHAHTSSKCSFFFVNPPSASGPDGAADAASWERVACLPRLVDVHAGPKLGFSLAHCRFCEHPEKAGTGRRAVGEALETIRRFEPDSASDEDSPTTASSDDETDERKAAEKKAAASSPGSCLARGGTMCYTLEMSFFAAPPDLKDWSPHTSNEDAYGAFGKALGLSFADFYGARARPASSRVDTSETNAKKADADAIVGRVAAAAKRRRRARRREAARRAAEREGDGDEAAPARALDNASGSSGSPSRSSSPSVDAALDDGFVHGDAMFLGFGRRGGHLEKPWKGASRRASHSQGGGQTARDAHRALKDAIKDGGAQKTPRTRWVGGAAPPGAAALNNTKTTTPPVVATGAAKELAARGGRSDKKASGTHPARRRDKDQRPRRERERAREAAAGTKGPARVDVSSGFVAPEGHRPSPSAAAAAAAAAGAKKGRSPSPSALLESDDSPSRRRFEPPLASGAARPASTGAAARVGGAIDPEVGSNPLGLGFFGGGASVAAPPNASPGIGGLRPRAKLVGYQGRGKRRVASGGSLVGGFRGVKGIGGPGLKSEALIESLRLRGVVPPRSRGGDGDEASAPEASTPVGESAEGSVPGGAGSTLARRADDSLDGFFGAQPSPSERRDRRLGFAASSDDSLDSESSGALLSGDASSDDGEEGGLALAEDGLPYGLDADLRRAEMFRAASEEAS